MANALSVELAPIAVRTLDGVGATIDISALRTALRLEVLVTDAAGSGRQLSVALETSRDGATGWRTVAEVAVPAEPTSLSLTADALERFVRMSWNLTGSFTFGVTGEAHVLYAAPAHVRRLGIRQGAIEDITDGELAEYCIVASVEVDGYLGRGYKLPLTAWDDALRLHCAKIVVYHLLNAQGRQPTGPDDIIDLGYKNAIKWLGGVGSGSIDPPGLIDSTPDVHEMAFAVESEEPRGWDGPA